MSGNMSDEHSATSDEESGSESGHSHTRKHTRVNRSVQRKPKKAKEKKRADENKRVDEANVIKKRKRANDDEQETFETKADRDEFFDKLKERKARPQSQQLETLPCIEIGRDDLLGRLLSFYAYRRPWFLRRDLIKPGSGSRLCAPFNDNSAFDWFMNDRIQLEFAERFFVPYDARQACRRLPSDASSHIKAFNATSAVLHAAVSMHNPSALDIPRDGIVRDVFLPQHHGDRLTMKKMHGLHGGVVGCDTSVLVDISER